MNIALPLIRAPKQHPTILFLHRTFYIEFTIIFWTIVAMDYGILASN